MEYGRANSPSLMNLTLPARADAAIAGTKKQDTQTVLSSEAEPLAQPKSPQQTGVPADATRAAIPSDNPQTSGKIALGQKLFFERRLSADGAVACSNCHDPKQAFTDGRPVSIGIKGHVGQRNAPTILNALYNKTQFWDGRVRTLEEQAAQPIVNPSEMGQPNLDAAIAAIASIAE
jgi:cytochrome c peroxidase